jgi:hypothetical protein
MEGTESVTRSRKSAAPTKRALIIEVWESLGRTMVGEPELREIQTSVRKQFGPGAEESPATIARVLADEGAELRHPEVIEFDARWRETKIESDGSKFKGLERLISDKPLRLKRAATLIGRLETLRQSFEKSADQAALRDLRSMAIEARQASQSRAKNRPVNQRLRREQAEIAQWFAVWIQTPSLFNDWLELRLKSSQFRENFPSDKLSKGTENSDDSTH